MALGIGLSFSAADPVAAGSNDRAKRHRSGSFVLTRSTATHNHAQQLEKKLHKRRKCPSPPCKGHSTLDKMK